MKKINRYSINKYFKKLEIETERKTPIDIKEFLKHKRYSKSKDQFLEIGKMDMIHLIRSFIKQTENDLDNILYLRSENIKLKNRLKRKG